MKRGMKQKEGTKRPKPENEDAVWQEGPYARHADFHFVLPVPFLMLCKLVNITPDQMLTDFMDNLSFSSWKSEGKDEARSWLTEYFIAYGYGQGLFTEEEIRNIFKNMEAAGHVWPSDGTLELLELSAQWREQYQDYWFNKWMDAKGLK